MQKHENQVKKISFEGEQIFVGIDVHKKSWKVSLYHQDTSLKVFSQDPDTDQLVRYLQRHYPGADFNCAYEAGFSGFWLQRQLSSYGINCMVVNPADIPTSHKEKEFKSDKRDCRKIAKALRSDLLEGIYVPTDHGQEYRKVVRLFHDMSRQLTRSKNKVKSMLDFHGIRYPEEFYLATTHWTERFFQWLKTLTLTSEQGTWTLQWYVDECIRAKEQKSVARKKVIELSKTELYSKNVKLLGSLPGVGLITAMTILTEIEDINRFNNLDKLCSYIGLIPSTNSSGEKEIIGDMTHRGNKYLRHVIIESSWIAIRKDPSLFNAYLRVKNDRVTNKGIIKVARKLVARILYVFVNQTPYQIRMEE
jgi:transposase